MTDKKRFERRGIGGPLVEVPDHPRLKLVMSGHGVGKLYVDGEEVAKVKAVDILVRAGGLNMAVIEIEPDTIEVEGQFNISKWRSMDRSRFMRIMWTKVKLRVLDISISAVQAIRDARK